MRSLRVLGVFWCCLIAVISAYAQQRIIQVDEIGNTQKHKQQYIIKDGKVYHSDSIGNIEYNKQQYKIVGNKLCPIDSIGNIEHRKSCMEIKTR